MPMFNLLIILLTKQKMKTSRKKKSRNGELVENVSNINKAGVNETTIC